MRPERRRAIMIRPPPGCQAMDPDTGKVVYTPVVGGPIDDASKGYTGTPPSVPDPTPEELEWAVMRHPGAAEIMFGHFHWRGGR